MFTEGFTERFIVFIIHPFKVPEADKNSVYMFVDNGYICDQLTFMRHNPTYPVKGSPILQTIICTFVFFITAVSVQAQNEVQELPVGKSKSLKLNKVSMVKVDQISHLDFKGVSPYVINLDFGKNTMNIELYEKSTGNLLWATYGSKKTINFVTNTKKSNKDLFVYEHTDDNPYKPVKCTVTFHWKATGGVMVSFFYQELDPKTQKEKQYISATGVI